MSVRLYPTAMLEPAIVTAIRSNRRALARLLTRIENGQARAELAALYPYTGHAHIIGVTGAPGTGKSSLVNALALYYRQSQLSIGIVAVDPTSPFSGGAILGDRIRMYDLSGDPGIFVRSMATRGNLGGLAMMSRDVIRAFDAAQFDVIMVETVGAGQSEIDIARAAQTTLVVEAPGMGDEVQAIKAGILEIADILVVNKADRSGAEQTVHALRAMLDLGHRTERSLHHGHRIIEDSITVSGNVWQPPVLQTVAVDNIGIAELVAQIAAHRAYLQTSGVLVQRERAQIAHELTERLRDALLARLLAVADPQALPGLVERVLSRELDPTAAVNILLDQHDRP